LKKKHEPKSHLSVAQRSTGSVLRNGPRTLKNLSKLPNTPGNGLLVAHVLGMVPLRTTLPSMMPSASEKVKLNLSHNARLVTVGDCVGEVVGSTVGNFVVGLSDGAVVGKLVGAGSGVEHDPKSTEIVKSHGRKIGGATFVKSPTT